MNWYEGNECKCEGGKDLKSMSKPDVGWGIYTFAQVGGSIVRVWPFSVITFQYKIVTLNLRRRLYLHQVLVI